MDEILAEIDDYVDGLPAAESLQRVLDLRDELDVRVLRFRALARAEARQLAAEEPVDVEK